MKKVGALLQGLRKHWLAVLPFVVAVSVILWLISLPPVPPAPQAKRVDQMTAIGLLGEHRLICDGTNPASFLSGEKLKILWGRGSGSEFTRSAFPVGLIRYVTDPSKEGAPTVEFVFDENFLHEERTLYTDQEKSGLNWWLDDYMIRGGFLKSVVIRISESDLRKGVCLTSHQ